MGPNARAVSPDEKLVATVNSEGIALVPAAGGEPKFIRGSQAGDVPLRWAKKENVLFTGNRGETACPVSLLDVQTGNRTAWKTFSPTDPAGTFVRGSSRRGTRNAGSPPAR